MTNSSLSNSVQQQNLSSDASLLPCLCNTNAMVKEQISAATTTEKRPTSERKCEEWRRMQKATVEWILVHEAVTSLFPPGVGW
jgi:hypothetical protein